MVMRARIRRTASPKTVANSVIEDVIMLSAAGESVSTQLNVARIY